MKIELNLPTSVFSTYFSAEFFSETELFPPEKMLVKSWSDKRILDFSTGRYCAREALAALDISRTEILIGTHREPLWPNGISGSISHAEGLAGAIVGRLDKITSVGLDIEIKGRVSEEMWYLLFTDNEQKFLHDLPPDLRDYYSTAFFSLKESFYKFQFPLTKTFLNFTDVELTFFEGRYKIVLLKEVTPQLNLIPPDPVFNCLTFKQHIITVCYSLHERCSAP